MNIDVVDLPQKRKCSLTSLLIFHERNYVGGKMSNELPMLLLLNISSAGSEMKTRKIRF